MQYTVVCQNKRCGKRYAPSGEQLDWIGRAASDGMKFIMLDCERCGHPMGFNPQHAEGYLEPEPVHLCCPVETCDGLAVKLPDDWDNPDAVYGCGHCGNEWNSKEALDRAITAIIARYPYRAGCYVQTKSGWAPVDYDKWPAGYRELVEREWDNAK